MWSYAWAHESLQALKQPGTSPSHASKVKNKNSDSFYIQWSHAKASFCMCSLTIIAQVHLKKSNCDSLFMTSVNFNPTFYLKKGLHSTLVCNVDVFIHPTHLFLQKQKEIGCQNKSNYRVQPPHNGKEQLNWPFLFSAENCLSKASWGPFSILLYRKKYPLVSFLCSDQTLTHW